jgi:hypothetical protein
MHKSIQHIIDKTQDSQEIIRESKHAMQHIFIDIAISSHDFNYTHYVILGLHCYVAYENTYQVRCIMNNNIHSEVNTAANETLENSGHNVYIVASLAD